MAQFSETLRLETPSPHLAVVTLHRPEVLNALNTEMARAIVRAFAQLAQDDTVRAIVLRGAGERAFCAGADLKERQGMTEAQWSEQHQLFEAAFRSVLDCRAPVIAAVEGYVLAGGLELALSADFIVASASCSFGQPEVLRGFIPGGGGTQLLPRRIGPARAKELILTGRRIDAETAECWGLVNRLTVPGEAAAVALEIAASIARNGPIAVRQAKQAMVRGADVPLPEALAIELACYRTCIPTEDRAEGIRAFNKKRPPNFLGR